MTQKTKDTLFEIGIIVVSSVLGLLFAHVVFGLG
jgi:hypothetical protein